MYIIIYKQDGNDLKYAGTVTNVEYDIQRRVYDLDTSSFRGSCDIKIESPFFYVVKEAEFEYAGWTKNFKQDGKEVSWNGIDLKTVLDTEVELDFNENANPFTLEGIFNFVIGKIPNQKPTLILEQLSDNTDITHLGNLLFQVLRENALKFLKLYMLMYDYYWAVWFDDETHEINIEALKNNNTLKLKLEDFISNVDRTSTNTNHAVASLVQMQEENTSHELNFIPTTSFYYDRAPVEDKIEGTGVFPTIPKNYLCEIDDHNPEEINYGFTQIDFNGTQLKNVLDNTRTFYLYIPHHKRIFLKKRTTLIRGEEGEVSFNITIYYTDSSLDEFVVYLETGEIYQAKEGITLAPHEFTDFGEGFFKLTLLNNKTIDECYASLDLNTRIDEDFLNRESDYEELMHLLFSDVKIIPSNLIQKYGAYLDTLEANKFLLDYAKPLINQELLEKTYEREFSYKIKVAAYYGVFYASSGGSGTISNGNNIFNKVGQIDNIPFDRIKIIAVAGFGVIENNNRLYLENGKYNETYVSGITALQAGTTLFRIDFHNGDYFQINTNFTYTYKYTATGTDNGGFAFIMKPFEKYWQTGQVPRQEKRLIQKHYYLGKDNQVYEGTILTNNKIYPEKTKYFQNEFLYKSQTEAISELVNSRFDEAVYITDNESLNPIKIRSLGLLAKITVIDKNNNEVVLPITEINYRHNADTVIKLGFKKRFLTEVIKG